jgi:glycosyltransferase involved in cell wall biosynthesis
MKITNVGIDLRPLQIGHQYRGIGKHLHEIIKNFPSSPGFKNTRFYFYVYPDLPNPIGQIESDLKYYPNLTFRYTSPRDVFNLGHKKFYEENFESQGNLDSFLFVDFNLGVPSQGTYKKILIMYDLIPLIMSKDYMPGAKDTFIKTKKVSPAIKNQLTKNKYKKMLQVSCTNADTILSISEYTKLDLVKHLGLKPDKVKTVLLGVDDSSNLSLDNIIASRNIAGNQKLLDLPNTKYVFFVGGCDTRRDLVSLVDAFALTKQRIPELILLFAGYDFQSTDYISNIATKKAICESDYAKDIYLLGFITESQKNSLYKNALAFVYPTLYEGFGLPVLESMSLECPVITYSNTSLTEVGGNAALYAKNSKEINEHILSIENDEKLRCSLISKGNAQVIKFSWSKTADQTLEALTQN